MDDEQLRSIVRNLTNTAIDNAMDKIFTEVMAEDLDQGVDDIVKLTIGKSITAIRDGRTSSTDDKMKEWSGHFDKEVSDIVELTIGQSVTAIRKGQTSPTGNKMEGLFKTTSEVTTVTSGSNPLKVCDAGIKQDVTGSGSDSQLQTATRNIVQGGSSGASVGKQTSRPSKVAKKKGWIRKNLLCCFVRQTSTVEPSCK
ncbi:uncharacterized protein LOC132543573 [Ylistrum balloti]|uniref:uncharacterized protein LOC132543573 n=1 Tax=Ylistrum balloti TaxID=509963 RepID=UPI002905A673|nr:uncharacterized protein LOC132543573 [Ylistrum balloti]